MAGLLLEYHTHLFSVIVEILTLSYLPDDSQWIIPISMKKSVSNLPWEKK